VLPLRLQCPSLVLQTPGASQVRIVALRI
jgi:hypothetical protein